MELHTEIVGSARASLEKAIQVGELIAAIKSDLPHGQFLGYCAEELPGLSKRTIQNYMKVFNNRELLTAQEITDPAAAYRALAAPRPTPAERMTTDTPQPEVPNTQRLRIQEDERPPLVPPPNRPPPIMPDIYDHTGAVIRGAALVHWNRSQEVRDMLTSLSNIRVRMEQAEAEKDKMYLEVNMSQLLADLSNAFQFLKIGLPFAVCPTCQGLALNQCRTCQGKGMVSEFYWKHKVPNEVKELRQKALVNGEAK
jgi:hypothetical protein